MEHLESRSRQKEPATYVSVGVRGEKAATVVADAKSYAAAVGVTFGSLLMQALADYMDAVHVEARAAQSEAEGRG